MDSVPSSGTDTGDVGALGDVTGLRGVTGRLPAPRRRVAEARANIPANLDAT